LPPVPFEVVLTLVAATGATVSPRQAPRSIALAIAHVAEDLDDASKLVVMAKRESDFVPDAAGDCDKTTGVCHSFGAWQLKAKWASRRVACDPFAAAPIALAVLRASARECPAAPLAVYASGSCDRGRTISRVRMREIMRLQELALRIPRS
jgi:hypothetical protein